MVVGVLLLLESIVIVACVLSMAGVLQVVVGVAELQKTMPNIVRHGLEDAYDYMLSAVTLHN